MSRSEVKVSPVSEVAHALWTEFGNDSRGARTCICATGAVAQSILKHGEAGDRKAMERTAIDAARKQLEANWRSATRAKFAELVIEKTNEIKRELDRFRAELESGAPITRPDLARKKQAIIARSLGEMRAGNVHFMSQIIALQIREEMQFERRLTCIDFKEAKLMIRGLISAMDADE